ncbi:MAG: iron ABC transporter permease [Propionibacteriaceae bacterium]|jgi:iron complex transport system permease protein|nr:iron ABC transporter permease [Propionibacteriaceae bacterium]
MSPARQRRTVVLAGTAVAAGLVAVTVVAFFVGSSTVGVGEFWTLVIGGEITDSARSILINVRAPRVVAALLAGAALATAGAIIQSVLDNPLASPNIIGINSGAGLAVLLMSAAFPGALALQPVAAFAGALVTALIIFALSLGAGTSRLTVVLAGIALSTIFGAGMNAVLIVNPDVYVGASTFLVGGLAGMTLAKLTWPAAYILIGLVVALFLAGRLTILTLGDTTAHSLGLAVGRWRLGLLGLAALLAGAAVSFAGLLGFVGLIVPHMVKFIVGHDARVVLPLSAALGAAFVVGCDLVARVAFAPYELPVGILMAFLGGPFFIYLIIRNRRVGDG